MEQGFIDILKKLIAEQGKETLLNASKCKAFLADYTRNEYKKESRLLLQALEAGVQKAIDTTEELEICKKQQIRVLREEHFVAEEAAEDIVDTLALVLRGEKKKQEQNICKNCGKEMQEEWKACPYCGTSVGSQNSGVWRLNRIFEGHEGTVNSAAFSPDGKYIVSGSTDETLKLWEAGSGRLIRTFEGHQDCVESVAFSPDGKYIVSGSTDKTLKLWETGSGRLIRTFEGHQDCVESAAFSPDGKYIVSGSFDETLKLWETGSGRLIRTFKGHEGYVFSVAFSPDGKYIVSGSTDKTLKLWEELPLPL